MHSRTLAVLIFALACLLPVSAQQQALPQSEKSLVERLGFPKDARLLIIQTDIGMMHNINRAAFQAYEKNLVTSLTVLVPAPWFPEAAQFARKYPDGDFGLHLAINSEWTPYRWGPISPRNLVPSLLDSEGYFPKTSAEAMKNAKAEEIELELRAQVERARAAGINITHFDAHMGTFFESAELLAVYRKIGREYGIPILLPENVARRFNVPREEVVVQRDVQMHPGTPYSEWVPAYGKMLDQLAPGGVYMLTLHLGYDDDEHRGATSGQENWGPAWRETDTKVASDPEFQRMLREKKLILVTWKELAKALPKAANY